MQGVQVFNRLVRCRCLLRLSEFLPSLRVGLRSCRSRAAAEACICLQVQQCLAYHAQLAIIQQRECQGPCHHICVVYFQGWHAHATFFSAFKHHGRWRASEKTSSRSLMFELTARRSSAYAMALVV
ncbi:hypothetical protein WJX77_011183 [Trebouxia sp. C0004]